MKNRLRWFFEQKTKRPENPSQINRAYDFSITYFIYAARSGAADDFGLANAQSRPAANPAQPPAHGRGWPQVAPPGSTAHAVGCGCGNCPPVQYKVPPIDFADLLRKKYKCHSCDSNRRSGDRR